MAITDYHRAIFDFLETYRSEHPEVNLTYSLRQKNKEGRPRNQYLFIGNDKYISIGLYSPHNGNTKTKSTGFICYYNSVTDSIKNCSLEIVYDDPKLEVHQAIYQKMIKQISFDQFNEFHHKRYELQYKDPDWRVNLLTYLEHHKPIIDKVIQEAGVTETFYIPLAKLEENIKVANQPVLETAVPDTSTEEIGDDVEPVANVPQNRSDPATLYSKNIILYGPPGTGKTYETIDLAVDIIDGRNDQSHKVNKARFDQLRKEGQIEFVTFHQNYTYEDFVMGLKPDVDGDDLKFQRSYGIFYKVAKLARDNYEASRAGSNVEVSHPFQEVFDEYMKPLVEEGKEINIKMASGTRFVLYDLSERSVSFRKPNGSTIHTLSIATLRSIYEGLQEIRANGLKPYYRPLSDELANLGKKNSQPITPKNYVLIIDEINRANMSRVFGELITLLEEDKRLGEDNELVVTLPSGEPFAVPPNLYLIGTMNTADKSLALLDIALRRRFEFIGKYPNYKILEGPARELLERLNQVILTHKKSADFLIGHAYFMNKSTQQIKSVLDNRVIPLLLEYFNGRTDMVEKVLSEADISFTRNELTYQLEANG